MVYSDSGQGVVLVGCGVSDFFSGRCGAGDNKRAWC